MSTPKRNRPAQLWTGVKILAQARFLVPMRPDKYVRMVLTARREKFSLAIGFSAAAIRCPHRPGLIDERGALTWKELDDRCNAFAVALRALSGGPPGTIAVMCRNHRGFVEALIAGHRIGANVVLLNTSFAGPALAEVIGREGVDSVVYDEEFAFAIERAVGDFPRVKKIVAWTDSGEAQEDTQEKLIAQHLGDRPPPPDRKSELVLLTSGTTGTAKGAKRSGGDSGAVTAVLSRIPWRAEESTVIVAPMFHAWGFGQLVFAAMMACTVVTNRKFDPEATLDLVDRYGATGLCVVPVMLDRIMELASEVRARYKCHTLRFVTASGSRMRSDVVIGFMDEFGDVVYNNYNATEAGMIATATPQDLRLAPDTAGTPVEGTAIRILDVSHKELPVGEIGTIYVRNTTQFDGYSSGATKDFHDGFMSSGDVGYVDRAGRLFVVGRDDEMIVSGGENVYPIEVEKSLAVHPDVADAVVLGVDDDKYGQRLTAFVVLEGDASVSADALRQHVRERLAGYKVPREVRILDELPRGATGKIDRRRLLG